MCSPLHIRAPTRPLILQCVTELDVCLFGNVRAIECQYLDPQFFAVFENFV